MKMYYYLSKLFIRCNYCSVFTYPIWKSASYCPKKTKHWKLVYRKLSCFKQNFFAKKKIFNTSTCSVCDRIWQLLIEYIGRKFRTMTNRKLKNCNTHTHINHMTNNSIILFVCIDTFFDSIYWKIQYHWNICHLVRGENRQRMSQHEVETNKKRIAVERARNIS